MTDYRPTISPRVRDITYFVLLGGAALALAVQGLAPIWAPERVAEALSDSAGVLVSVLALIGGGLGVTYRPGKNDALSGAQSVRDTVARTQGGRHSAEDDGGPF